MTDKEVMSVDAIGPERLLREVDILRISGWRLIQILGVSYPGSCELSYSFGLELAMRTLRFSVSEGDEVPSITALYPAAFLYENEIRDLFGVGIERIGADWEGRVFDVEGGDLGGPGGRSPFSKVSIVGPRSEGGLA
jgi:ech hydrogenase subunit D